MAYFKVLFQYLPEATEEEHGKSVTMADIENDVVTRDLPHMKQEWKQFKRDIRCQVTWRLCIDLLRLRKTTKFLSLNNQQPGRLETRTALT